MKNRLGQIQANKPSVISSSSASTPPSTQLSQSLKTPDLQSRFLSSLIAGFTAVTICSPLDVAKTRLQIQSDEITKKQSMKKQYTRGIYKTFREIWKEQGLRGMFRGYRVTVICVPLFHSLYFPLYQKLKVKLHRDYGLQQNSTKLFAVSACFSGFLCNVITNPFWVFYLITCSLKFNLGIYKLFSGLGASLLGLIHVVIHFPLYEKLKLFCIKNIKSSKNQDHKLKSSFVFFCSLISKFVACGASYWHQVLRARQQDTRRVEGQKRQDTIFKVLKRTLNHEGIKGLYSGFRFDVFRILPQNAIIFVIYQYLSDYFERTKRQRKSKSGLFS